MPRLIHAHEMHPLHDTAATRRIEQAAAAQLPAHTLMQRAGLAVARLALALAPHARTIWVACGPGNNGGDGLEAAMHLRRWGLNPVVTWLGNAESTPTDARASWVRARDAGVHFAEEPPKLDADDLCIDALLGIGAARPAQGRMAEWLACMATGPAQRLAVDAPTGLNVDTGSAHIPWHTDAGPPRHHTLSLLTLKPGLFTMHGRDACGTLWFDELGISPAEAPVALLNPPGSQATRPHASHKGTWGDVAVIGGESDASHGISMRGAALLAARSALSAGAGRVYVSLLGDFDLLADPTAPALMFRRFDALDLSALTSVCGCGGGEAVVKVLPALLAAAPRLVLDADALNAIARDPALQASLANRSSHGQATVLTPHPLEAARLLACTTAEVQADRLACARELAQRFRATVVLKGSGSVIAAPDQLPYINPTGNARLATAGTGDVLAGMIGARLAAGVDAFSAARTAVWQHGHFADVWPYGLPLTAERLATPS
ncbi:bifunctional ADP-dependent NAD(P)H-hydrate dehydratase/NAD(P)H-hydrate epimerase [Ottowia thiooxydans]|uniref:bifunctional ADP-dependent NAD(P)H-hydrate dehydratase/NAD(P)H-hydrate epimerase n=1 Tax=Ottowia thiooxydans TaxID=219182 RepID=UPI00048B6790|nr:bifunctional ADP-dependent NAD(P)H-hydrate dehydratase/NAD(P)H-hydrate epimerase [Ottowia thiooxydans]